MKGKTAIFIDGSNLLYSAINMGIEIDYNRLYKFLTRDANVLRCYFYTGIDYQNDKQIHFLHWMRKNNFRVVSKDLITYPDGKRKANLDIEIAVDMMMLVGSYDTAVLVSGDGDLAYVVNALSYKGIRVEVISYKPMTSDQLIEVSDKYTDLADIKDQINKQGWGKDQAPPLPQHYPFWKHDKTEEDKNDALAKWRPFPPKEEQDKHKFCFSSETARNILMSEDKD